MAYCYQIFFSLLIIIVELISKSSSLLSNEKKTFRYDEIINDRQKIREYSMSTYQSLANNPIDNMIYGLDCSNDNCKNIIENLKSLKELQLNPKVLYIENIQGVPDNNKKENKNIIDNKLNHFLISFKRTINGEFLKRIDEKDKNATNTVYFVIFKDPLCQNYTNTMDFGNTSSISFLQMERREVDDIIINDNEHLAFNDMIKKTIEIMNTDNYQYYCYFLIIPLSFILIMTLLTILINKKHVAPTEENIKLSKIAELKKKVRNNSIDISIVCFICLNIMKRDKSNVQLIDQPNLLNETDEKSMQLIPNKEQKKDESNIKELECGHSFHLKCFENWLKIKGGSKKVNLNPINSIDWSRDYSHECPRCKKDENDYNINSIPQSISDVQLQLHPSIFENVEDKTAYVGNWE